MKRFLFAAALAAAPALAAEVGVSIGIGQPGFYGRIDIGQFPHPAVIYAEPLVIQPAPIGFVRRPIYLRVPPGHAKDWRKHCHRYNACGQPVFFVQENWYRDVYAPRHREAYRQDQRRREPQRYEREDDRRKDGKDNRGERGERGDRGKGGDRGRGRQGG
ncbi:MAG TPA: hypothetical protein PK787_03580 [Burkholderiaceae bacterium]|jgi:hypothetical protein|nr:hypothetical protein [Burkholderiaceae bacterium]